MIFACYQRFHRKLCLFLLVLLGLACGQLAATLLGSSLRGQAGPTLAALPLSPSSQTPPQNELGFILQHNPFNSAARSATPVSFSLQDSSVGAGVAARGDLELLGTIVAGSRSVAVIRLGQEVQNFHLGEEIPGGAIEEILRNQVSIRNHDRSLTILSMERIGTNAAQAASEAGTASAESARTRTPPSSAAKGGVPSNAVRSAGANRWIIARSAAEAARENIGEQLRTALIQPNLVNGKTDGFVVRRIQRGTLLAQMGLQRGDVIKRVNRMPLDSPEKALQILQQLREARQLSVDLERAGTPLSFAYEIE
jgi:general secretion pathway protein C